MVLGPWTVTYTQELIQETGMVPDEKWRFIDKAGHGHFADGKKYPTLRLVREREWCEVHEDMEDVEHFECPHCGETVSPKWIDQSILGRSRLGPISMTITHRSEGITREFHLGDEDARAVLNNPIEEIPKRTANVAPTTTTYEGGW